MSRLALHTLSCLLAGACLAIAGPVGFNLTTIATSTTDPDLINPWGMSSSPASPIWISVNGSGVSELYNTAGVKQALVVTIPGDGSVTGTVFSGQAGQFNGDTFLFVSEDGTISGWRGTLGTNAETLQLASPAAVYKGMALGNVSTFAYAYAANFRSGAIDVLAGASGAPALTGHFTDPTLPSGYAPFNIQNLGGTLYVTYAVQDAVKKDDVAGPGNGIVDAFDLNGNFLRRVATGGPLNSPWGLAIAPAGFGDVGGDLLVGNFGDGAINAYNPMTGASAGPLLDALGNPLRIEGLWGLRFGNGGNGGNVNSLYFTAGPNDEAGGVFGRLDAVPEPATWALGATLTLLLLARNLH